MRIERQALVLAGCVTLATMVQAEPPAGLYELSFELQAEARGGRASAEIVAGGRLLMAPSRSPDGTLQLRLERVLEAPWKLYHVDPVGPFGEETKVAAVITLPDASWPTVDARRREMHRFAGERYAEWAKGRPQPPELDGAFAFVVIGPGRDRFGVEIGPDGALRRVENRLTDRWLTGPFDRFIGGWGPDGAEPGAPQGYWFWNDGETEPFDYEPHTYRALAAALRLLEWPLPGEGPGSTAGDAGMEWPDAVAAAQRVVETLAPKMAVAFRGDSVLALEVTKQDAPGGFVVWTLTGGDGRGASVSRSTAVMPDDRGVHRDHLVLRISEERRGLLLVVGYRPVAEGGSAPDDRHRR